MTIAKYTIVLIGVTIGLSMLGMGWSRLQWLVDAMGLGLGFRLQEIFANFISGLVILFERPVRVGDMVTIGDAQGRVTRIRMRATTVIDWDRREMIIPNKELITGRVTNWTLSDPINRLIIQVGITYGSDTAAAKRVLLQVAKANAYVLNTPEPVAIFRRFGESALEFELRVFVVFRDVGPEAIDSLHLEIDRAFREAGIELAFPARNVYLHTVPAELSVPLAKAPAAARAPAQS
jgi:potassium efflux system protein